MIRKRSRAHSSPGRIAGIAISSAGLGFVLYRVAAGWSEVWSTVQEGDPILLLAAIALGLVGMTTIGVNWSTILGHLGSHVAGVEAVARYFVGQLGKYVPGGIWPLVGRAEMARRSGVDGTNAYGSTLLSMALTYLAALISAAIFFALAGADDGELSWATSVLLVIPIGLLALHPAFLKRLLRALRAFTKRELNIEVPGWSESLRLTLYHMPAWAAISAATYLTMIAVGGVEDFAQIGLATCMSWFLGFVVVGLPSGLGIREAVFTALAVGLDPGVGAAVALASRIVFVAVDLLGASLASAALQLRLQRKIDN